MGGGFNHRIGLYDGILIKDNHISAAGSITKAVDLAKLNAPHTIKVEVEVEDFEALEEAIQAGASGRLGSAKTESQVISRSRFGI